MKTIVALIVAIFAGVGCGRSKNVPDMQGARDMRCSSYLPGDPCDNSCPVVGSCFCDANDVWFCTDAMIMP